MRRITKFRGFGWVLGAVVGVCVAGHAFAQAAAEGQLKLTNAVYQEVQVTGADGKVTRKLVPATRVAPGGEVIYEIEYANGGKRVATDVVISNPLPNELLFEDDSKTPATDMSVDHGKTYGKLAQLTVTGADGKPRPARTSDVTDLRWVIPSIAAGAKGKVSFRARVK